MIKMVRKYNLQNIEKKFAMFSVEELDNFILSCYREKGKSIDDEIIAYLKIRKRKLDKTFEWTAENREKLLRLNKKYIDCWEKLCAEARPLLQSLQKRIDENDSFLHDFGIDAKVDAYMTDENGEVEDCIEEIVFGALREDCFFYTDNHASFYWEGCINEALYLNPELNCNIDPCFQGIFDNEFISHAIHDLYDHTCLSFHDMLKINRLWAELQVVHQHFVEV